MATLLLIVIYIAFISLGLPDGLLGSAWPAIQASLQLPVGLGGLLGLVSTVATIVSSLATATLAKRLGTGPLLAISTTLTAGALVGYSLANNILWLFLLAVPLGLGAGAIDTALNNYVATHYKAHHMNWLHAFWGFGAALGPAIFAASLIHTGDWHTGYATLGLIQASIIALLLLTLWLWKRVHALRRTNDENNDFTGAKYSLLIKNRAVLMSFLTFYLYVGFEIGIGLWLASYLVALQKIPIETASFCTGLYYGAITVGRLIAGFVSFKVDSKMLVRAGSCLALIGCFLLVANLGTNVTLVGIALIGLGFAPIYPGLIHQTPLRFSKDTAAKVMSLQMVGGAVGAASIPPLIGLLSNQLSLVAFAYAVPVLAISLLVITEKTNNLTSSDRNMP